MTTNSNIYCLRNIPKISIPIVEVLCRDLREHQIQRADAEFLRHLSENNPVLYDIIKELIKKCDSEDEYQHMMVGIVSVLKLVDVQLGVNSLCD